MSCSSVGRLSRDCVCGWLVVLAMVNESHKVSVVIEVKSKESDNQWLLIYMYQS